MGGGHDGEGHSAPAPRLSTFLRTFGTALGQGACVNSHASTLFLLLSVSSSARVFFSCTLKVCRVPRSLRARLECSSSATLLRGAAAWTWTPSTSTAGGF